MESTVVIGRVLREAWHTVVSLPYYLIHLKEKIILKLIQKSKLVYLRFQMSGNWNRKGVWQFVPYNSKCNGKGFSIRHTVVSLPYYLIHLKEKIKAHSKVKSRLSEVPKGASTLQTLPKILILGHKWPSRPFRGKKFSVL